MFISLEPSSSHLTENTQFCWVSSMGHMGHWVGDHSLTQSHSPGRLAASDSKCRQAVDTVPSSSIVARSSCRVNNSQMCCLALATLLLSWRKQLWFCQVWKGIKSTQNWQDGYKDLSQKVIQIQIFEHLDFYVLYPILSRIHFIC